MSLRKFTLSLATVASLSLLVACSSTTKSTPSSQASTSSEASTSQVPETSASSSTTSAKTDTTTNIDGTYKGQDEGDSITLVVTGNTGTWTEVEANGDQEVKKVTFEPENQRVFIGDDTKIYVAEENQIIIDDMARDVSDRIVLKKQLFCKDLNLTKTGANPFSFTLSSKKFHTFKVANVYHKSIE